MRQRLAIIGGALGALLLFAAAWLGFVYSGFYNVAASQDHSALTEWTLETISERSVRRRAGELPAPLPTDSASLLHGFEHYRAMCEVCHGAPGVDRNELAEGLNPRPPRLVRAARGWSDAELFWITKHGIKATGMPGFGGTHDDASLLQIVAIVRELPDMTEQQYADLAAAVAAAGIEHTDASDRAGGAPGGHSHAPGTPVHSH